MLSYRPKPGSSSGYLKPRGRVERPEDLIDMDVPFSSSGATSRQHYVIVRKVENASSSHLADQYLLAEVKSIQHELENPTLSLVRRCGFSSFMC